MTIAKVEVTKPMGPSVKSASKIAMNAFTYKNTSVHIYDKVENLRYLQYFPATRCKEVNYLLNVLEE